MRGHRPSRNKDAGKHSPPGACCPTQQLYAGKLSDPEKFWVKYVMQVPYSETPTSRNMLHDSAMLKPIETVKWNAKPGAVRMAIPGICLRIRTGQGLGFRVDQDGHGDSEVERKPRSSQNCSERASKTNGQHALPQSLDPLTGSMEQILLSLPWLLRP